MARNEHHAHARPRDRGNGVLECWNSAFVQTANLRNLRNPRILISGFWSEENRLLFVTLLITQSRQQIAV